MEKLENVEKINIYMSERMKQELYQDADRFEVFYDKNHKLIMNRFLSRLIKEYYEPYKEEQGRLSASIKAALTPLIDSKRAGEIAKGLTGKLTHRHKTYGDDSESTRVSYKPTHDTDKHITDIRNSSPAGAKLSTELRRMFSSYLSMPMYERERIIFKTITEKLAEYCQSRTPIRFTSSKAPSNMQFHVIPYEIVHGSDEMFNYLICQCYDEEKQCCQASTFRLCRLGWPYLDEDPPAKVIQKDVKAHLEKMKRCGPQYAINEDIETIIQLTPVGQKSYAAQYLGRPNYLKRQELENGYCNYIFENSTRQLFFYFRRFSAEEAVVISPDSLKEQMKAFHDASWKAHNS